MTETPSDPKLPPPPGCQLRTAERILCGFLKDEIHKVGFKKAVLGLSGGIDSALVVELAARALGPENVLAVAMPYRTSQPISLELARESAEHAGVRFEVANISSMVDSFFAATEEADSTHPPISSDETPSGQLRRGNVMARARMITLYDRSARDNSLVLGTSNKTELLLGYGTIHGDMASALNPIGDLYKSQIVALSRHLGVPDGILNRPPSADLWEGQTDEEELGFSYDAVDSLLYRMVDKRWSNARLENAGFSADFIQNIQHRVRINQYKRRPPLIAKVANRTVNLDFRYARDWGC